MAGFSYLLNRRGHYYFRIAIPHALVSRFNARELIYSLKTKNLGEAKLRCRSMHQAALWLFRGIEGMPRITPEEAKRIAQLYFKECLDRLAVQVVTVDLYSDSFMKILNQRPDIPAVAGEGVTDDLHRLDFLLPDNFEYKNKDNPVEVTGMTLGFRNAFNGDRGRVVDYLIGKHGIDAEKGSLSYKTLEKAVGRAIGELLRIHQAKADLEADIPIVDEWFIETAPKVDTIAPPEDETPLVSVAKSLFLEESLKAEEAERTLRRKDTAISFWIEVMGDMPMGSITKKGARTYKETLAKLPANMKKRYPDKTVKEIVALSIPSGQLMKPQTINDYLGKMQSFIKWAQNNGYYPDTSNPFAGMSLKDRTKKKKKRESFSDDQLKTLFSTPVHTGCKGSKQTERYQAGEVIIKDAIYWLPLIALHTGARMGEIAVIEFDNLTGDLVAHKSLCTALTSEYTSGRILGVSKTVSVSTRTLFLSSGNNVGPIQDMARRCITINLDPACEIPAARTFKNPDLLRTLYQRREEYVSYALTIIRAWIVSDKPKSECRTVASYGAWSDLCRQPLLWLGLPDPAHSLFNTIMDDPERELLGRFLEAWQDCLGSGSNMIRKALEFPSADSEKSKIFREIMQEIAGERDMQINRHRLGWWMKRNAGKIVSGRRLVSVKGSGSAAQWKVETVS